jgi:hypothetical protein
MDKEKTSSGSVPVLVIHKARLFIIFQLDQSHLSTRTGLDWTVELFVLVVDSVVVVVEFSIEPLPSFGPYESDWMYWL